MFGNVGRGHWGLVQDLGGWCRIWGYCRIWRGAGAETGWCTDWCTGVGALVGALGLVYWLVHWGWCTGWYTDWCTGVVAESGGELVSNLEDWCRIWGVGWVAW